MSLLNAALRKKEKEKQHLQTQPLFNNKPAKIHTKTRFIIYGIIACLALATGLAIPYIADILLPKKTSPPLLQTPDIIIAKQDSATASESFSTGDIKREQELNSRETMANPSGKQRSSLPAQTKEIYDKVKTEKKLVKISETSLLSTPVQKIPSSMLN